MILKSSAGSDPPSVAASVRTAALLCLGLLLGACQHSSDSVRPSALPYRFATAEKTNALFFADLNGDGTDERLSRKSLGGSVSDLDSKKRALKIQTQSGRVIEQVNYAHPIQSPHTVDLTGDGRLEIVVPFVRNDSLFLSIVDGTGTKRNRLYITQGEPRREPEGRLPWDPEVQDVFWTDTNGDGTQELLTLVQTRYARLPRGVWIHDLSSGQLLGKKVVGATLDWWTLDDLDEDGHQELLVASGAANNGAEAGGMSDQYAYQYAFDLGHPPTIQWKREIGSPFDRAELRIGDLDGDGRRDYIGFLQSTSGRYNPARLHRLDPATGAVQRQETHPFLIEDAVAADLDGDGRDEIFALDASGVVHQMGQEFQEEERAHFGAEARGLTKVSDVTGDGRPEVLLTLGDRTLALGKHLSTKAAVRATGTWHTTRREPQTRPYLYRQGDDEATLYRLAPNQGYLLYRWGPWILGLVGVGLLLGGGYGIWRGYLHYRSAQEIQEQMGHAVADPLLLARDETRIEPVNPPADRWLDENGTSDTEEGVGSVRPEELSSWLKTLDSASDHVYETDLTGVNGDDPVRVRARPVTLPSAWDEHSGWLLHVVPPFSQADPDTRETWRLMAQRVAHDLRNPLTSIRLGLQSMQMAYRDADPDIAGTLDAYVEQIDQQVESLRRTATNVMKFVGAEEPNELETDLCSFLKREGRKLSADLPDDVKLQWELAEDLPSVLIDREQMASVLENLIYNAVEALPEGGVITVQTQLARDLSLSSNEAPRDYLVIDVMDTGEGMDAATRSRAFQAGFTTTTDGTGLGLAMVKRIVENHDGHIELESEPDVGTDVRIYLPTPRDA